jgi:hypothetical protein
MLLATIPVPIIPANETPNVTQEFLAKKRMRVGDLKVAAAAAAVATTLPPM